MILPSIIATSQEELNERISKIKNNFSVFHLDIMDGKFVNNKSLDFNFKLLDGKYEAHLMVENPEEWVDENLGKVDTVIVHIESLTIPHKLIQFVHDNDKKIGFAINPETSIDEFDMFIDDLDLVLLMTVVPGQYGAAFVPEVVEKIKEIHSKKPDLVIEVDGSINADTINKVREAGASRFVIGSYLQRADSIREALDSLQ